MRFGMPIKCTDEARGVHDGVCVTILRRLVLHHMDTPKSAMAGFT